MKAPRKRTKFLKTFIIRLAIPVKTNIAAFCRCAHLSEKVEVGYGLGTGHVNSRPADVLAQGWDREKRAAFDVTVRSVLSSATINEGSAAVGAAAFPAEAANDDKCQELGWSCISFAVETYGNWGKEAQCKFTRPASLLAIGQTSSKAKMAAEINGQGHLRKRVSWCIV